MRTYSKTKAIASHVTWTEEEVIPVTVTLPGTPTAGQIFGRLKISGRAMYLRGFRVDLQDGSSSSADSLSIGFADGYGSLQASMPIVTVTGKYPHGDRTVSAQVGLPTGSYWALKVTDVAGTPGSDLTVTYWLTYANSPIINYDAVYDVDAKGNAEDGIGIWVIHNDFVVTNSGV